MTRKSEIPLSEFHQETSELSLSKILAELKSPNRHPKGRALELLAIRLTRLNWISRIGS